MKKNYLALMMAALSLAVVLGGCAQPYSEPAETPDNTQAETTTEAETTAEPEAETEDTAALDQTPEDTADTAAEGVMTHADFVAADLDTEVVIETYVQAKQGWWTDGSSGVSQATFYTQDEDGGYFIYNMACSEDEYNALTEGTKIRVTGYKAEWSGEVEIIDASFEILDGNYVAAPVDVTDMLGTESDLIAHQNEFVSFTDMTVEAANDAGDAFLYKWDGSGSDGDDLYFNVSANGETYTFTVESYLCDNTTDVYAAVKNLQVGDVVSMEGFLYWYEGANPHITSVTVR